jgi:ubiquinone/menaquinone biosynthesis C-methylase UbiE
MNEKKFDPKKLEKLNNPERLKDIPPSYIWDKLNIEHPEILVEIGAGTAFFSIAFLRYAKASKIYACDVSEIMIGWIRENIVPNFFGIIPVKTEEYSIPLDDGMADVVFTINLHHELDNQTLTIREAHRILKPGGSVFIVDWKKEDMAEGPPLKIRCLPEEVGEQLADSGFQHVEIFAELPKHFVVIGRKDPI